MGLQEAQVRVGSDLMAMTEKLVYADINAQAEKKDFVLEPFETCVVLNFTEADTASVTLPDPSRVIGVVFMVQLTGATSTLNVGTAGSTLPSWTDKVLTTSGDHVVAVSNGFDWIILKEQIT